MSKNNCLPPTQNVSSSYGYFKITPSSLTFFKNTIENPVIKVQFWGTSQPVYIPISQSEVYTVTAPLVKFKQYLVDSKATSISIVDSRNYKSIANTFVHWPAYLRHIKDKKIYNHTNKNDGSIYNQPKSYYLPFYDEVMQVNLPLLQSNSLKHKSNQKIGQLMLKWQCRIWIQDINFRQDSNLTTDNVFANLRTINDPTYGNNQNQNQINICKTNFGVDETGSFIKQQDLITNRAIKQNLKSQNQKLFGIDNARINNIPAYIRNITVAQQKKAKYKYDQINQQSQAINVAERKETPSQLSMQLQLLRLRLEVQQLIKVDKSQQKVLVYIVYFQSVNRLVPSKQIRSIDIQCKNGKDITQTRIFSHSIQSQKNYFYSSMITEINSSLTFTTSFKKDKKALPLQGSIKINYIGDSVDVNLLSSQGIIIGFLKVKAERKSKTNPKFNKNKSPINEELIIQQNKNNITKQELQAISFDFPNKLIRQNQPKITNQKLQLKQQKALKSQSNLDADFFLAVIKQNNKYDDLDYNIFNMNISHLNHNKFVFVSQQKMIDQPFQLLVFQMQQLVYHQEIIAQLKPIPSFSQNLLCSLLYEHTVHNLDIVCQLYGGNLQQINRLLQQLMQPSFTTNIKRLEKDHHSNTEQAEYNPPEVKQKIANDPLRKLKTQGINGAQDKIRRMTEQKNSGQNESIVPLDKLSMNEGVQSQNPGQPFEEQNIYLVDLLTRFLDSLTPAIFPPAQQIKKSQFIQIITNSTNSKSSTVQMELIQIISSIFQSEIHLENINLNLVNECYKAYQTFLKMYHEQRQQLVDKILATEPKAVNRIKASTEMDMINESMLWGRALQKVKDKGTRQKINKFYKISSFNTTDCHLLLQDLQNKKQISLRSLDISNLGMIIKQWVEQFIKQLSLQNILPIKQNLLSYEDDENWLNIKNISESFQQCLGLRLSMWESLMLIEEIKGAYSCDLQLEEGIITANSLLGWINSIYGRNEKDSSDCSSSQSLDPDQLALIKNINKSQIQQQRALDKQVELSSRVIPNNNYSDIADIANLLREKDGFSPFSKPASDKTIKPAPKKQIQYDLPKRINTEFSDRSVKSERDKCQKQLEIKEIQNVEKNKKDEKIEGIKQKWQQFYIQIRQLKLYDFKKKSKLLKAILKLEDQKQSPFYYLTADKGYCEANNQIIKYVIDVQNIAYNQSGFHIDIKDEIQKVVVSGLLPIEDIVHWLRDGDKECKKTIVLYEAVGQICGKMTVKLIKDNKQMKNCELQKQNIQNNEVNYMSLIINNITPNVVPVNLSISVDKATKQTINMQEKVTLQLCKPIYQSELYISDKSGQLSCTISLEQLYLKRYIQAEYPLINNRTAHFVKTLTITMSYMQQQTNTANAIQQIVKEPFHVQNGSGSDMTYMLSQIDVMGYKFTCSFTAKLYCYIYKEQAQKSKDQLVLVTPSIHFRIKEQPTKYFFKQQRIEFNQSDQSTFIQFKLMADGTLLASTQRIKMSIIKNGLTTSYISMLAHGKYLFSMGIKKIKITNKKYSLRRVYQCVSNIPQPLTPKHLSSFMKTLKQQYNLTVSQIQVFKDIAQSNQNNKIPFNSSICEGEIYTVNLQCLQELFPVIPETLASIINEFMYLQMELKRSICGALQKLQIMRVLSALKQDNESTKLITCLQQVFEEMTKDEAVELPYTWIFVLLEGKKSPELQQKKKIIKQIDGIYQSMLHKYA